MDGQDGTTGWAKRDESAGNKHPYRRRGRVVPPAITPVRSTDLAAGLLAEYRGRGRNRFRDALEGHLGADRSATYTSFRRTLAGCFRALRTARDREAEEVLIPAFCSSDFRKAIEGVGLTPTRYDIDSATLGADLDSLEARLREDTLAVITVSPLGYGPNIETIAERCTAFDTYLVEALGYALGSKFEGRPLGTFGDCAVLNFQQGKPIPVGGGMIVSQDETLTVSDDDRPAVAANVLAVAGYAALSHPRPFYAYTWLADRLEEYGVQYERVSTHPESKFNVEYEDPLATISNFQGAIAHRIFRRRETYRKHRVHTARFYASELAPCPNITLIDPVPGLTKLQYVRFPILLSTKSLRDTVKDELNDVGVQATTLYDWPVLDQDEFPGASSVQRRILTLPTHPYVDGQDRRLVVDTIRDNIPSEQGLDGS